METTFISIHDNTPDATTLYCSDSIVDVLGYAPAEVLHRSCWDYFHPDELPVAKQTHDRSIDSDKAAMLRYCRLLAKDGNWVGCEVVFTVVYDVMVGCISIYRRGKKSQTRAADAPNVRRIFSTSPRDPRYHMLSHLSAKFTMPPEAQGINEPRAALFLNRYTRTLTIMYATDGLADLLGISGERLQGNSFYYCMQEQCLGDAVNCLEKAKTNNSIAYLRFWYRDPRLASGDRTPTANETDVDSEAVRSSDEELDGANDRKHSNTSTESRPDDIRLTTQDQNSRLDLPRESSTSSGNSNQANSHEAIFGEAPQNRSSSVSSVSNSPTGGLFGRTQSRSPHSPIELEAVISCTSDGLVVCMRQARPLPTQQATNSKKRPNPEGLYASPWASEPLHPPVEKRPRFTSPERPSDDYMNCIRDCAVFAWALTGINGALAEYGSGRPRGESQPEAGLPVWQAEARQNNLNELKPAMLNGDAIRQTPLGNLGDAYTDNNRPVDQP